MRYDVVIVRKREKPKKKENNLSLAEGYNRDFLDTGKKVLDT